ncbi:hypothetical protein C8R43DRAFT_958677 [Mycena crocata]|nr:hypothetical protein C8R43DRAFT_958677 [Mycena crocata]
MDRLSTRAQLDDSIWKMSSVPLKKMVDLEALEVRTVATAGSARSKAAPRRFLRLASRQSNSTTGDVPPDWQTQLQTAREQLQMQAARIHELENHMDSEWALGLSDEPPPGFSEGSYKLAYGLDYL